MLQALAENLPIVLLFLAGVVLLGAEAFLPGFGICGLSGAVAGLSAIALTWVWYGPMAALGMMIVFLAVVAIAVSIGLRSVAKGRLSKSKLVLNHAETTENGYVSGETKDVFLNREGVVLNALRPVGTAEFDGVRLDVVSDGEFLDKGERVRIVQVDGSRIVVRKIA